MTPAEKNNTPSKHMTIFSCTFNFNILAVIVSEIIRGWQIYIRQSCAPLTPLWKTFYSRNESLFTSNCVFNFSVLALVVSEIIYGIPNCH